MSRAARLLSTLRSLSRRERLLVLLCAVVVAVFALVRWGVQPALKSHQAAREAVPRRLETLSRYRLAAQGEGAVAKTLADASSRLETLEKGMLPGNDPAAAGAALQGILKPMVERPDTRVTSVRALAPAPKGAYTEVAVQVELQTTTERLAALLADIPRHPTILRVGKLSIRSGAYGQAAGGRRETLGVSIVVAGIAGTRFEAKGEGATP